MQKHFQKIIESLKNKQFDSAIKLCQSLLTHTNHPQIHLFLAIAYGESGKLNDSAEIFHKLIASFPQNADIYYNFALILQHHNENDKALSNYKACLQLQPQNFSAWNNLGEIYRSQNKHALAIDAFNHCLSLQPNNLTYMRNLGISHYQNNAFDKAQPLLMNVVKSDSFEVDDCLALLDILITLRHLRLATDVGDLALGKFQNNEEILNLIGLNELEKRKFKPAINYFKQALSIEPEFFSAMSHLASAYMFSGDNNRYLDLLTKIKNFATEDAFVFVGMMYQTSNQTKLAQEAIKQGLTHFPNNEELLLLHAKELKNDKDYTRSLDTINQVLHLNKNISLKSSALYIKAQVLDKLDDYDLSWQHFSLANQSSLEKWSSFNSKPDAFIQTSQNMVTSFNRHSNRTHNKDNQKLGSNLIFIVGFPRSGTTLLDSILSAHSDIEVLEEAPIIGETYDQINQITPLNYASCIDQLTKNELNQLRSFYYNSLHNYSNWDHAGILVDKSPLNTLHVALIYKLFPDSKIIFSLRHPMDVCISCFFQDFKMNGFMSNMTTITNAANTYDHMLKVWRISVEKFKIPVFYQSYEKLVMSFEKQTRQLFDHLKIPWQEQVLTFQETLGDRGAIATPSYDQVNQPIYQTAKNRYKNYLKYLDDSIEILKPWIKYFQYEI